MTKVVTDNSKRYSKEHLQDLEFGDWFYTSTKYEKDRFIYIRLARCVGKDNIYTVFRLSTKTYERCSGYRLVTPITQVNITCKTNES